MRLLNNRRVRLRPLLLFDRTISGVSDVNLSAVFDAVQKAFTLKKAVSVKITVIANIDAEGSYDE